MPRKRAPAVPEGMPDLIFWENVFGTRLREARTANGLSLRELEKLTGVTDSEIHRIETGDQQCRLSSFVKLCSALGIPPGRVLDDVITNSITVYRHALMADPGSLNTLRSFAVRVVLDLEKSSIVDNIAAGCALAAHLLRCSFAERRAMGIEYPNAELREKYLDYAKKIDGIEQQLERLSISKALLSHPVSELQHQSLWSESFIREVLQADKQAAEKNANIVDFLTLWKKGQRGHPLWLSWVPSLPDLPHQVEAETKKAKKGGKQLTETSIVRNTSADMKPVRSLKDLIERVRRLTEPRGMKAKLAAELGVPQARVSEWLAAKHEPSGEMAIRLHNWVCNMDG